MFSFGNTKSKINPRNILGGILGSYEEDYEREITLTSLVAEKKADENGKFPSTGSIEDFQQQKAEADRKKAFFQTLKEEQYKVQVEKDKVFEEELNDIVSNLPTEQKNRLLHYQANYKDKSVYQRAELRRKLIEEQQKAAKQEKEASIPSPAKQPSAMEGAFEGRMGSQGSGQANLSAQAVG